ncbi:MAG: hypothetical protein ACI3Y4_03405 [Candidatus Cryptobacteroides sp.]
MIEDRNGNPAYLVAITDAKYFFEWKVNHQNIGIYERVPGETRAKAIRELIFSEWENDCSIYNDYVPGALTQDQDYWIDEGEYAYRYSINLYTGNTTKRYETDYYKLRALLFREEPTPKKTFI